MTVRKGEEGGSGKGNKESDGESVRKVIVKGRDERGEEEGDQGKRGRGEGRE